MIPVPNAFHRQSKPDRDLGRCNGRDLFRIYKGVSGSGVAVAMASALMRTEKHR